MIRQRVGGGKNMARKQKKHRKQRAGRSAAISYRQLPLEELRRRATQCCDDGDPRTAIDMAKECYRQQRNADHTELLRGAYIQRGRQLMERGQPGDAADVLSRALQLGAQSQELLCLIFECGVRGRQYASAIGTFERLRDGDQHARARCIWADAAVVQGTDMEGFCDEDICQDAALIRQAFKAYEQGDSEAATAALRPISLGSACADWKWLLRGLLAWSAGNADRAVTMWSRATSAGDAARLATMLCSQIGKPSSSGGEADESLGAEAPVVVALRRLKDALAHESVDDVLRSCRRVLSAAPPGRRASLRARMARVVAPMFGLATNAEIQRYVELFGTPSEDPTLSRISALAVENDSVVDAIGYWHDYLHDISDLPVFGRLKQRRIRALIFARIGDLCANLPFFHREVICAQFFKDRQLDITPAACYARSVLLHEDDPTVQKRLWRSLLDEGNIKEAEQAACGLLDRFPDDVDSLLFVANQCVAREAFRKAIGLLNRARQIEPLSASVRGATQDCYLKSARRRARNGHLALARKDLHEAIELTRSGDGDTRPLCAMAAVEWLAGSEDQATLHVERARRAAAHPLIALYDLASELAMVDAPAAVRKQVERDLTAELKSPPDAATAVEMARRVAEQHTSPQAQRALAGCTKKVMGFLERALKKKVAFDVDQLEAIIANLFKAEAWPTVREYATVQVKRQPENAAAWQCLVRATLHTQDRCLAPGMGRLLDRTIAAAIKRDDWQLADELRTVMAAILALMESVDARGSNRLRGGPDGGHKQQRRRRATPVADHPLLFDDLFEEDC